MQYEDNQVFSKYYLVAVINENNTHFCSIRAAPTPEPRGKTFLKLFAKAESKAGAKTEKKADREVGRKNPRNVESIFSNETFSQLECIYDGANL